MTNRHAKRKLLFLIDVLSMHEEDLMQSFTKWQIRTEAQVLHDDLPKDGNVLEKAYKIRFDYILSRANNLLFG